MIREINALELRKHFGEIMDKVRYSKEPYIIKRNGRPMMVLLDIESFEASREQFKEESFIEDYSDERIREFMKEDEIDADLRAKINENIG